uniref:Putative secreted protein n=1 Tax=Anopheles darlingi TaxID=43151 RepID=A0A2M4DLE8_ANODA
MLRHQWWRLLFQHSRSSILGCNGQLLVTAGASNRCTGAHVLSVPVPQGIERSNDDPTLAPFVRRSVPVNPVRKSDPPAPRDIVTQTRHK